MLRRMALSSLLPIDSLVLTTRWGGKAALVSNLVNRALARRRIGERLGYFLVSEYPKSGGTWFGKMAAETVQLPYPEHSVLPIGCPAVIHNHWTFHRGFRRAWYVCRDGRDVMVSLYFHRTRFLARPDTPVGRSARAMLEKVLGRDFDPADSRANMLAFIRHEFANPRQSFRANWRDHVMGWLGDGAPREHVHVVKYESLLEDAADTLGRAVEWACGRAASDWVVNQTVEKHSMARQTGRKPGSEDRGNFIRKGVAGDWMNHFSAETAAEFDRLAGDALIALGYESDRSWVDRVTPPPTDG
jgi:hypothetical protein